MFRFFPALFQKGSSRTISDFLFLFILHEFEDQLWRGPSKEYLMSNGKPSKAEVFVDHYELSINPLRIKVPFCCYLSLSSKSLQVLAPPLFGCRVAQFNRRQDVSGRTSQQPSPWTEIDLKGRFAFGYILCPCHLLRQQHVPLVRHIDHFVSVFSVFADPQSLQVELRECCSCFHRPLMKLLRLQVVAVSFREFLSFQRDCVHELCVHLLSFHNGLF
mmetsp:Transcript_28055/g.49752  ORF Transcript_28055/g.49752 Transcript_28055/m.49752 type:complete len:217 (-) Transcript_28055:210-860(-)